MTLEPEIPRPLIIPTFGVCGTPVKARGPGEAKMESNLGTDIFRSVEGGAREGVVMDNGTEPRGTEALGVAKLKEVREIVIGGGGGGGITGTACRSEL